MNLVIERASWQRCIEAGIDAAAPPAHAAKALREVGRTATRTSDWFDHCPLGLAGLAEVPLPLEGWERTFVVAYDTAMGDSYPSYDDPDTDPHLITVQG